MCGGRPKYNAFQERGIDEEAKTRDCRVAGKKRSPI